MLIVALVLAVIGLAALVTAVVTSNEVIAWVCIAASSLGVILLIVDAIRERQLKRAAPAVLSDEVEVTGDEIFEEDHPEEIVHDEPEYDTYSDDEPEYPESAEESAVHIISDVEAEEAEEAERSQD